MIARANPAVDAWGRNLAGGGMLGNGPLAGFRAP